MHKPEINSVTKKILIDEQYEKDDIAKKIISLDSSSFDEKIYSRTNSIFHARKIKGRYSCRNLKTQLIYHNSLYQCNNPSNCIYNSFFNTNKIEKSKNFQKALNLIEKSSHIKVLKTCSSLNVIHKSPEISRYSSVKSRYKNIRTSSRLNLQKNEEFSISSSIKQSKYRSRSLDQFLESQTNFLNHKTLKIAHNSQMQVYLNDKSRKKTPVSKQLTMLSRRSPRLSSAKRTCPLLFPEKNLKINKKVKLSEFQKYVKDNLSSKPICNHFSENTCAPKIRKPDQKILFKKLIKDIDRILLKNHIYSNHLTFTDMELVFENLGFKTKDDNTDQTNALKVIWNSINSKGNETIPIPELKIALMALSKIKIPNDSFLLKNSSEFIKTKKDSSASDNSIFSISMMPSNNILQLNHLRRNKSIKDQHLILSMNIMKNKGKVRPCEVFSRLTKKVSSDYSIKKVFNTKNSPKLNLIFEKSNLIIEKAKINQSIPNLVSHPKFRILDKKPYMILNSECTFTPNIS